VLQGYESISGIMNVLLKDHGNSNRLLLNAFMNSMLEKQFNLNFTNSVSSKVNTILSLHSVQKSLRVDENNDGFLDNPLITRYMLYNKWNYSDEKSRTSVNFAGRYWNEERIGGQKNFNDGSSVNGKIYGQTVKINSIDGYSRFSKEFDETSAMKIYLTSSYYDQKSVYGSTGYNAKQTIFSAFGFYEFEMSEGIEFKTGLSNKYLGIEEDIKFNDTTSKTYAGNYLKKESIPGVFAENSIRLFDDKASLMTGIRLDYHNEHKLVVTPRALFRYQPSPQFVMRASIGTGFRTLNMFSEYSNLLSSSRNIVIAEQLEPEKILNYGADVIYYFGFGKTGGSLNIDFYRTDFSNKIIPDYDADPSKVIFSNLHGRAYSNVLQTEINLTLFSNIDLKIAYKYVEMKYEKNGILYDQPFNAKHRVLSALSYSPAGKSWSASGGIQWFGKQRLPSTMSNPVEYRRPEESKPYAMLNAQVNKNFKKFEVYAGVENILNFTQDDPIISADNPFGKYFDTSFNWGPTKGREFYAGFRFLLD
jgi:outer membrane receptor protein involved in Fe transport